MSEPTRLTDFQEQCLQVLRKAGEAVSTTMLRCRLQSNALAVTSAMRSLQRREIVGSFPSSRDQWSQKMWFIRKPEPSHD